MMLLKEATAKELGLSGVYGADPSEGLLAQWGIKEVQFS
jgi:hypothetical protein